MLTQQEGKGLAEDLIKPAGPLIVQQAQAGLQDIQRGKSAADTWADRSAQLSRGLKRKAPAVAWTVGKHKAKRTAQNTYKRATQRVRDIFGLFKWYVWEAFSKRKIVFDDNALVDGSFRRIKRGARFLASRPWRTIP